MKLQVATLPNAPWEELVERWRHLDELGVETIWIVDHLGNAARRGQTWFDALVCLAAMATEIRRARIGALVHPMTFRNAASLAKAAVTLDHLSGGRVELGVGAGGTPFDDELARVERVEPEERARRFADWLEHLLAVLGDETLAPPSVQERIPLTIGGHTGPYLELSARFAERWNSYGGRGLEPEEAARRNRARNELLDRLCEQAGRDPRSLVRSVVIGYPFVHETPWRSEAAFGEFVQRWEEAGFDELVCYYPPELGMPEGAVEAGLFERMLRQG